MPTSREEEIRLQAELEKRQRKLVRRERREKLIAKGAMPFHRGYCHRR